MPEKWTDTIDIVGMLLQQVDCRSEIFNERHLHHFFSHHMQARYPDVMNLTTCAPPPRFHPEWPTYKEAAGIAFGRYHEQGNGYVPVDDSGTGGFIDFAIGAYDSPDVGVEFKLLLGWQGEAVAFDYMKLLDGRNPFKAVIQATVLMRPHEPARGGGRQQLLEAMGTAHQAAVERLAMHGEHAPARADRHHRFLVTEVGPTQRRHWCHEGEGTHGQFTQVGGVE